MPKSVVIAKTVADKHQVFGWANVSVRADGEIVKDHDEDIIPIDELEDAAYSFALSYRDSGAQHRRGYFTGRMIESVVITKEKLEKWGLKPDAMPQGWWVGFQIEDETAWEKITKGEYQMFSIEGEASSVEEVS